MRNISLLFKNALKFTYVFVALSVCIAFAANAQDAKNGRLLFKQKCTSCHALDRDMTGPALQAIVKTTDEAFLLKWINNAPALIASGDKEAVKAAQWNPDQQMQAFATLTEPQIKDILGYIKEGEPKSAAAPLATGGGDEVSDLSIAGIVLIILAAILVLIVLGRATKMLERVILQKQGIAIVEEEKGVPISVGIRKLLKNKKFVFFLVICAVVSLGSFGWMGMWNTGVHTGYQPVQPIKFSHELHAGVNQIDCQYCHAGAFKSKNSTIPSLNVCMNCHKVVQATEKYDGQISPEIQKIYDAIGFNPEKPNAPYDVSKQRPVEWVRIHNLPDLAYFNHSQHVVVGEVNTMEEMYQYSPLTMKWCINCHRAADISDKKDDAFYAKIIAAHEKIKKGEKITPALLGGLECGKCHY
jgi:mono/diheme cytochrome c family protein